MNVRRIVAVAVVAAMPAVSQAALVAYNDFDFTGTGSGGGANAANVTTVSNSGGSGNLLNQANGTVVGKVTLSLGFNGVQLGSTPTAWPAGESYNAFNGKVSNVAGFTYGSGTIAFSNLDVADYTYELILASYPGNQPTSTMAFTITGARPFTNLTTVDSTSSKSTSSTPTTPPPSPKSARTSPTFPASSRRRTARSRSTWPAARAPAG